VSAALAAAIGALVLGVTAIATMLQMRGPLELCGLLPPHCISAHLTGESYFWGEGLSVPAFHLRLIAGPVLSIVGVYLVTRGRLWTGIALAVASALAVGLPQLLGTYALMPLGPLVFAATTVTFSALLAAAARA